MQLYSVQAISLTSTLRKRTAKSHYIHRTRLSQIVDGRSKYATSIFTYDSKSAQMHCDLHVPV